MLDVSVIETSGLADRSYLVSDGEVTVATISGYIGMSMSRTLNPGGCWNEWPKALRRGVYLPYLLLARRS